MELSSRSSRKSKGRARAPVIAEAATRNNLKETMVIASNEDGVLSMERRDIKREAIDGVTDPG